MTRRARRYAALFSTDAGRLVEALTRLHDVMMVMQARLVPGTPSYCALDRLSDAVIDTIRIVSGQEPDWMEMRVHGPDMPGPDGPGPDAPGPDAPGPADEDGDANV